MSWRHGGIGIGALEMTGKAGGKRAWKASLTCVGSGEGKAERERRRLTSIVMKSMY